MAKVLVNQIRKKNVLRYNGEICVVLDAALRTPPNLRAFFQMQLRALKTGKLIEVRCATNQEFELLETRFKNLEYSYENRGVYVFMDPETYEQYEISIDSIRDQVPFLVVSQQYEVMFVEGEPIQIILPSSVVMTVTETADAVRGNTATNVTKEAVVETGLKVQVPLFIKVGDRIKIGTEDKEYLGRA